MREVFRYIDKDGKNALSKLNLKECLKEININLSDEELELVFKILDANQSNAIEYQEFLRATCDKNSLLTEENLKNTFFFFFQGKGKEFINGNDIKKFIFHDLNIEDNILNEYLEQFGMKNGEKMDFKQFCEILKNDTKLNLETIEGKKDSEESSNEDEDN